MEAVAFQALIADVFAEVCDMNATKGKDYAVPEDALAHLREQAAEFDLSPEMVWGVLARKHWTAIVSYVKRGQVHSEPIESRVIDLILYLIMLLALTRETTKANTNVYIQPVGHR